MRVIVLATKQDIATWDIGGVAHVLLVEDHPDVRFLLEHVVLRAGYSADVAETWHRRMRFSSRHPTTSLSSTADCRTAAGSRSRMPPKPGA